MTSKERCEWWELSVRESKLSHIPCVEFSVSWIDKVTLQPRGPDSRNSEVTRILPQTLTNDWVWKLWIWDRAGIVVVDFGIGVHKSSCFSKLFKLARPLTLCVTIAATEAAHTLLSFWKAMRHSSYCLHFFASIQSTHTKWIDGDGCSRLLSARKKS